MSMISRSVLVVEVLGMEFPLYLFNSILQTMILQIEFGPATDANEWDESGDEDEEPATEAEPQPKTQSQPKPSEPLPNLDTDGDLEEKHNYNDDEDEAEQEGQEEKQEEEDEEEIQEEYSYGDSIPDELGGQGAFDDDDSLELP